MNRGSCFAIQYVREGELKQHGTVQIPQEAIIILAHQKYAVITYNLIFQFHFLSFLY